jgi:hypothetical protein
MMGTSRHRHRLKAEADLFRDISSDFPAISEIIYAILAAINEPSVRRLAKTREKE